MWATCFQHHEADEWEGAAPLVKRGMREHDFVVIPKNGAAFWVPYKIFHKLYTRVAH